jgi:hypothetical protein
MDNVHTIYLIIVSIFSTYIYWFITFKQTKSYYRAFDYLIITFVVTVILGRIGGILLNWESFQSDIILYPIFVQDSTNALHLSNNIPWIFLKVWDGKFDFLSLLYSPILTQLLIIKEFEYLKTWRKSSVLFTSSGFVFFLLFKGYKFLNDGAIPIEEVLIVFLFVITSISFIFLESRNYKLKTNFLIFLLPIYVVIDLILGINKYDNFSLGYFIFMVIINSMVLLNVIDIKSPKYK